MSKIKILVIVAIVVALSAGGYAIHHMMTNTPM